MLPRSIGFVYPLWNHRADHSLLERLHDAAGVDHVTIPVVTGPWAQFRYFESPDRPYFNTDGGWHYRFDERCYADTLLTPFRAEWLPDANPLEDVVEIAKQRSITLCVRIRLTQIQRLLAAAPQVRRRDAWGQSCAPYSACPSQPAVRGLLRAVLSDLRRFAPALVQIDDFGAGFMSSMHNWSSAAGWYRGWASSARTCFCDACCAIASSARLDPRELAACERDYQCRLRSPTLDNDGRLNAHRDERLVAYAREIRKGNAAWLSRLATEFPQIAFMLETSAYAMSPAEDNPLRPLDPQRFWGIAHAQPIGFIPGSGGSRPRTDHLLPVPGRKDFFFIPSPAVSLGAPHRSLPSSLDETQQIRPRAANGTVWWEFEPLGDGPPDEFDNVCRRAQRIRSVLSAIASDPDRAPRSAAGTQE